MSRVKEKRDPRLRGLLKAARRRAYPSIKIGVIGNKANAAKRGDEDSGVTVGQVAEWAEFGIGQPRRSWLFDYFRENKQRINGKLLRDLRKVVKKGMSPKMLSNRLGAYMVGRIQKRISEGIEPPNAESTKQAKGSSTPLIDTGQLRSSISYEVE